MSKMADKAIMAQVALTGYVAGAFERMRNDERGQGSVEYVGIILVVVAIVAVIIAAAKGSTIGQTIMTKIEEAIKGIGG